MNPMYGVNKVEDSQDERQAMLRGRPVGGPSIYLHPTSTQLFFWASFQISAPNLSPTYSLS